MRRIIWSRYGPYFDTINDEELDGLGYASDAADLPWLHLDVSWLPSRFPVPTQVVRVDRIVVTCTTSHIE